jgi:hypothetical protein
MSDTLNVDSHMLNGDSSPNGNNKTVTDHAINAKDSLVQCKVSVEKNPPRLAEPS